jgi:hypothetical protein
VTIFVTFRAIFTQSQNFKKVCSLYSFLDDFFKSSTWSFFFQNFDFKTDWKHNFNLVLVLQQFRVFRYVVYLRRRKSMWKQLCNSHQRDNDSMDSINMDERKRTSRKLSKKTHDLSLLSCCTTIAHVRFGGIRRNFSQYIPCTTNASRTNIKVSELAGYLVRTERCAGI